MQSADDGRAWRSAFLIAALALGIYLFANSRTSLWDRDEPSYARAAVEMRESGNYLVPSFNGRIWTDKPILFYWLLAGAMEVLGPTEFACRFWSAIGMATTCLLVFAAGKRLVGWKAGLWAMSILGSSLMAIGTGTAAIIDASLLPILTAVMLAFVYALTSQPRLLHAVIMGAGLGLGMLAKGPVGLLPLTAMAVVLFATWKTGLPVRKLLWMILIASVIGGLVFLAWALPVSKATNGQFMRTFIGHDVVSRALTPMEGHGGNLVLFLPYYLIVTLAGFFPWTLHLPGAISAMLGMRLGGRMNRAVMLGWIIPVPVIMTLAATKLPHYILFIWPGLALVTAATLVASERNELDVRDRRWLQRGGLIFGPLAVAISLGLMVGPWFVAVPGLREAGLVAGAVIVVTTVVALRANRSERFVASAKVLVAGMVALQVPLWFGILPALERIKVTPAIGRVVNARTPKVVGVATYGFAEPSLNFYVGRQIRNLTTGQAIVDWAHESKPGVLVIPRKEIEEIQRSFGVLPLATLTEQRGFNYSKGEPVDIVVMLRGEVRR